MRELSTRFWEKVDRTEGCWLWTGCKNSAGYGMIRVRGEKEKKLAHRVAWEMGRGPIPDGYTIDHLCRVTLCVNPDHLEPVPFRINVLRGISPPAVHARKTTCPRGHAYVSYGVVRRCRQCDTANKRARRVRKRLVS